MKKFSILLLFFTLCISCASIVLGQPSRKLINVDSLVKLGTVSIKNDGITTLNGDTISGTIGPIIVGGGKSPTLNAFPNGRISISGELTKPTRHYYEKDGERYYIESVPPTQKGKRADDSNVWLLHNEVAQAWH